MLSRLSLTFIVLILVSACSRPPSFTLPAPRGKLDPLLRFRWEVHPEPILSPGKPGSFDSVEVRSPSVLAHSQIFYSGFDGKSRHTGIAHDLTMDGDGTFLQKGERMLSPDPATWEGGDMAANGAALYFMKMHSNYYWYEAGSPTRIGLATQGPGMQPWKRHGPPVLTPGPRGSWDEGGVADPYVIWLESHDWIYLYYTGTDRVGRQRIGVARSRDGVDWEKSPANPIFEAGAAGEFDEAGPGEPAVWEWHGRYWMLYTGRASDGRRAIGLAESRNGVDWRRSDAVDPLRGRPGTWTSDGVRDPALVDFVWRPNSTLVWFAGSSRGTTEKPARGGIGYAVLHVLPGVGPDGRIRDLWR